MGVFWGRFLSEFQFKFPYFSLHFPGSLSDHSGISCSSWLDWSKLVFLCRFQSSEIVWNDQYILSWISFLDSQQAFNHVMIWCLFKPFIFHTVLYFFWAQNPICYWLSELSLYISLKGELIFHCQSIPMLNWLITGVEITTYQKYGSGFSAPKLVYPFFESLDAYFGFLVLRDINIQKKYLEIRMDYLHK